MAQMLQLEQARFESSRKAGSTLSEQVGLEGSLL